MALLKDRVGVASGTTGSGAVALGTPLAPGTRVNPGVWKTFAEAGVVAGDTVRYLILDANGAWEYGLGVYAEGVSTTFDPPTALDTILSNGNLTATHNVGTVNTGVKGTPSVNTGKYYFEITRNGTGSSDGLGLVVAQIGTYGNVLAGSNCTAVFTASGNISSNGIGSGKNVGALGLNGVIGVAVDFNARKAWFRRNGGNWNGLAIGSEDPVAGLGGVVVAPSSHFLPVVAFGSGAGSVYTANFGATAYANAAPTGFVNWPPAQTGLGFDPATATSVVLSDGNLTVTGAGTTSTDQGAKLAASAGKTTGKYYFEQTIMALTTSPNRGAGIGTTASTYTGMGNSATTGVNFYPNSGGIFAGGVNTGIGLGGRSVNDVIGYAVDLDNRRIWIRPNPGSNWNNSGTANPVTNVGGITIPAGTMVPFCTFGGASGVAGSSFKANFGGSAFAGAIPDGFAAGWLEGFPSAATTGPAPGTVFTTTAGGELVTTANGQVIEKLNHAGYILIKHSNVTIRDCIIGKPDNPSDVFAIGWDGVSSPVTGLKVLRCRINGGFALGGIIIDTPMNNTEIGYCDISRVENGITVAASNINIHDNYIHNLQREPGHVDPHFDCIQGFPGSLTNWMISHNTLETKDTSGMITGASGGANSGLTFRDNLVIPVEPVSYGIQVSFTSSVTLTNNRFRRLTFSPDPTVYPVFPMDMVSVTGLTHSGNVDDVTGDPLTPSIS